MVLPRLSFRFLLYFELVDLKLFPFGRQRVGSVESLSFGAGFGWVCLNSVV